MAISSVEHPLYCNLLSAVSSFSLTHIVSEPTCTTNSIATLIDLTFVSSLSQVELYCTIPPLANSDHNGLQLTISIKSSKRSLKGVPQRIWKYCLTDFNSMADYLDSIDWNLVLVGDIDCCWMNWKNCFMQIMELTIPNSAVIPNGRVPWVNHTIIKAIHKRKLLYGTFKHTNKQADLERYKTQVVTMLRECKEEFFHELNTANAI